MKKLFTILLSLGVLSTAFAQSGHYPGNYPSNRNDSKDVVLGQSNNRNIYNNDSRYNEAYGAREKAIQIARVNQDFDNRIVNVKRNRHLKARERKAQIRYLETQRQEQIRQINIRFSNYGQNNHNYNNRGRY